MKRLLLLLMPLAVMGQEPDLHRYATLGGSLGLPAEEKPVAGLHASFLWETTSFLDVGTGFQVLNCGKNYAVPLMLHFRVYAGGVFAFASSGVDVTTEVMNCAVWEVGTGLQFKSFSLHGGFRSTLNVGEHWFAKMEYELFRWKRRRG